MDRSTTVSQTALECVLRDIRSGTDADYVNQFFADRPDWQDEDGTTGQTDDRQAEGWKGDL